MYICFFISLFLFPVFRELVLEVFLGGFGFLLLYFIIPLLNSGTNSGWGVPYSIMAEMFLGISILSHISYMYGIMRGQTPLSRISS